LAPALFSYQLSVYQLPAISRQYTDF